LEAELLVQADRLVGGKDAVLVSDDTAMPKKGDRSVAKHRVDNGSQIGHFVASSAHDLFSTRGCVSKQFYR
jgi:hypothetical protein